MAVVPVVSHLSRRRRGKAMSVTYENFVFETQLTWIVLALFIVLVKQCLG